MFDVLATIENIVSGDDEQINPHQEVGEREVFYVERMYTVRFSEQHPADEYLKEPGVLTVLYDPAFTDIALRQFFHRPESIGAPIDIPSYERAAKISRIFF